MNLRDPQNGKKRAARGSSCLPGNPTWYMDALIYELHVRAFHDSNGDGVGDLPGLISKLDYLSDLGVTALWLLPFYPSPLRDGGYDIADYMGVHPAYGSIDDVAQLLDEAHQRGLRVITELVLNHTSSDHAWFKRARHAPAGSPERDYYVWSDSPEKYTETRIIFTDFESSNWSWDPVAKAYYWHRFYAHQPDLNFDNPEVRQEMLRVVDFWLELGVDGLRLDAVPYLFERAGTSCENLPETHGFLRDLRSYVDAKFDDRMLLAEANQWPADAAAYFGAGDECHMNFHFPLMPRMFMAVQLEDSFPILDILAQTPAIPANCQWATFLRNHDELTLEMVTDEERDFMVRVFADDPNARINLGIRRRLAPLLRARRKIELVNALLFSLPGTPVLYYGDEIGMGDNIYLGDRDGVRTPMQWSTDRNGGFSDAPSQRLYLPLITDSEYHHQAVNVEAQQANPSSLLWWMKRLIAIRKQFRVFGRGSVEFLGTSNEKVIAFVRSFEDERVLVVANLSRFPQHVELQTAGLVGHVPVELFGRTRFPRISGDGYVLSFSPHGFYWFLLEPEHTSVATQRERLEVLELATDVTALVRDEATALGRAMEQYLPERRWFRSKTRLRKEIHVGKSFALPGAPDDGHLAVTEVQYLDHEPESYLIGLAVCEGKDATALERDHPHALIARTLRPSGQPGVLYDALALAKHGPALRALLRGSEPVVGEDGQLVATTAPGAAPDLLELEVPISAPALEQTNSTFIFGDRALLKVYRLIEEGESVEVEMGNYLCNALEQPIAPRMGTTLELRVPGRPDATLAALQQFVPNQGDAWHLALDWLGRCFERGLSSEREAAAAPTLPRGGWVERTSLPLPTSLEVLLGGFPGHMRVLGRRTAELHLALLRGRAPGFAPEPFTTMHAQSVYQRARAMLVRTCDLLGARLETFAAGVRPVIEQLLALETHLSQRLSHLAAAGLDCLRIRHHGDLHLGQVLKTGDDFVIIDFEGEPARQMHERRYKRGALRDVAGMMRSFQYAAAAALRAPGVRPEDLATLSKVARACEQWAAASYLGAYLQTARGSRLLPSNDADIELQLDFYLMEKAIYEIAYEANHRPDWLEIPVRSLLELVRGSDLDGLTTEAGDPASARGPAPWQDGPWPGVRPRVVAREDAVARRRHRVAVQRSRCISYLAVGPVALLLRSLGAVDTSVVDIALIVLAAQLTVVAGWLLASRDLEARWGIDLWWLWGLTDTLLVSLGVYVSGGLGSPWFMFYLLNMLGAGFVLSVPLAALVALANALCYLGVLLFMGHIQLFDAGFGIALARMLVMGTVFAFALQGIVALKHKRMLVRRLKEDESRKVRELTWLTAALDHRTRALADANQRIREADRLKSRFLANMSHELRTPLNSIIGFSEILETRLTNLDPRHAKFLRNIHTSGSHLLGIINDILDLSKVEAGRMELHAERLSFTRLTDGVLAVMKGAATARGVVLEVETQGELPELEADPVRAKQILYNLLANAVKFSPDGGTVTVTARALTAEASPLGVAALEFAVVDHGIGIDPKDHELVFQEFRQVDSGSARKYEGTGLGLALVRKFVALHRGELRLESQLGQGSRFIVTLPLKASAGDPSSAALPPALPQGTHLTVLVVEDDPTVYEKIAADLERGQYRCVRARTGEEALELVRSQMPAAITLDLVLPGMDGWEVLRQLKQDAATRGVPVVIVSMLDSHELGVALGADGYFVKPPDGDELLRRIAELVPRPAAHLLAIDDDAQVHELLDATLTPRGYTLDHALSGADGLARAIAAPPDLVILDLMMQGMDGFEVAARLKSAPSTAHVPILVLTAKDLSADERRQLSGHIGALLQKGEARESGRLLETLQELLRRSTTPEGRG